MVTTLSQFRSGDQSALESIYGRYRGPVFVVASDLSASSQVAREVVASTFEETWRAAARFESDRELGSWLFGHTVATARQLSQADPVTSTTASHEHRATDEGERFETAWATFELRRAIDDLPRDERLALELRHLHHKELDEIVAALDAPEAAAELSLELAERRLAAAVPPSWFGSANDRQQLLSRASTWAAPEPALDQAVLSRLTQAVAQAPRVPSAPGRDDRRSLALIAVVAVLFLLAGLVIALVAATDEDSAQYDDRSTGHVDAVAGGFDG